ncbi:UNVERIFIED_CONTAM: putative glycosyltransferase [Sesamum calycinum]|uniref:Glycosyltransferase n=1 Tax=Sesamum calycinum TaxID=2727403 RepID=A0AAW2LXC9_9LAMI
MKSGAGAGAGSASASASGGVVCTSFSIVLISAVFAASIAFVFLIGYFSHGLPSSFYSPSQPQFHIPIVELLSHTRPAPDQSRAVLSSEFSSKFKPPVTRRAENKLEQGLARARAAILKAASATNSSIIIKNNEILSPAIYWNPSAFYQSYKEMERRFKVFKTSNAQAAHVYFMPFSVTWMVKYLYKPNTYNVSPLKEFVSDYVKLISTKHPFWNRTQGADHFMLSCHDWGPKASQGNAFLYNTSMRVLCNANSSEGFDPTKDVSLPEIHLYGGIVNPKLISPPPSTISRPNLAFFAGGIHGPIRPILLKHWRGKDTDLHVYEYLPKDQDYYDSMLRSKFCLCPSGYEVASPELSRPFMLNASQ